MQNPLGEVVGCGKSACAPNQEPTPPVASVGRTSRARETGSELLRMDHSQSLPQLRLLSEVLIRFLGF